jgi:hypothetical protein
MDLERVVAAADKRGLCCDRAAAQFGVGVNTAFIFFNISALDSCRSLIVLVGSLGSRRSGTGRR